MIDLISRSALIEAFDPEHYFDWYTPSIIETINEQPTVDAKPVVHGEWERIPYSFVGGYRCSCCGQKSLERTFNFCGNCGAKMDGKKVQK